MSRLGHSVVNVAYNSVSGFVARVIQTEKPNYTVIVSYCHSVIDEVHPICRSPWISLRKQGEPTTAS